MASIQDAIRKTPPGPSSGATTNVCQTYFTAATAAASTVALVLPNAGGISYGGSYVTWVSTVDCHVRVGTAALVGSATTNDFFLAAGVQVDWWHDPDLENSFSVIRSATAVVDGLIMRAKSNR